MSLNCEPVTTAEGLECLRHCYRFVDYEWQRTPRLQLPDQGFEIGFRAYCVTALRDWKVSQPWELGLGEELATASGVRHEIDLVVSNPDALGIAELKNRPACPPGKDDIVIFFARTLDFFAHNPKLLLSEVVPVYVSSCSYEEATIAACVGLGIHPVAPGLRPLPVLADSLQRIEADIARGLVLPPAIVGQWEDVCAGVNRLTLGLRETWVAERCGYVSDTIINLRRTLDIDAYEMSRQLRQANGDCTAILAAIRSQKAAG